MFGPAKTKDEAFLGVFIEHAAQSVAAAGLLLDMLEHPERKERIALDITEKEATGDRLIHETVKRLHETWITPFDRDDIHALISRLDDVLDFIEAVADRVVLFEIREIRPGSIEMARLLVKACEDVHRAMMALPKLSRNSKARLDICVEINRLENETDAIYRREIADLFRSGNDPLLVLKWRDILDNLEEAADRCEDVANIIEGIVLEYA
jgi:predicted phosphate transport protein (TIGR00153 family)